MDGQKRLVWWKDIKLLAGIILIILNIVLGIFGKVLIAAKFYEPVYVITGISIYVISWLMLFAGAFLVGWETLNIVQTQIRNQVKKTVKGTYNYTKGLPKKSYDYTKELHRKSMDRISRTSKDIVGKIRR